MLLCFDKAERHLPDRCLRQFGFPQPIPESVRRWEKKIRSSNLGKEVVNTRTKGYSELTEWYDRKNRIVECGDEEDETKYFQWYDQITRRFVGRPESTESELPRMVALMKEIANIVAALDPGPIDKFVLYDQENHVSSAVWDGQERGVLRCKEHTSMLKKWTLTSKQIELVEKAGFGYLRKIPSFTLDNSLISALVERWRSETNTFHLPYGEMTITLEDVGLILGLAIDGKPVLCSASSGSPTSICESLLGKAPNNLNGGMLKLTWLKECFSKLPTNAPIEIIERYTRAYILYLVGSTIFSTTTGNTVPVMYLSLFESFEESGKYAWGAAALSFLYRSLGNASLRSRSTISGSLTLLQSWCYFHLQLGRPEINEESGSSFPFARRWKGKQTGPRSSTDIVAYRKALDSLSLIDIQWAAYMDLDFSDVPEHIKENLELKASKTMLICFDKGERHMPDRCLRQFGFPQPIPEIVRRWEKKIHTKGHSQLKNWYDRKNHIVECGDEEDETEYFQWYDQITRRFVGRPESREAELQRMVALMKEIADIANAAVVDRLDSNDKQSMIDIKTSVNLCLTKFMGELR